MFTNLTAWLTNNWLLIAIGGVLILLIILLIVFWPTAEKKPSERFILCPLRQKYFLKYDRQGKFSEEYQRIRLITYLLKKGYSKSVFRLELSIEKQFGHKGQSRVKILVDLALVRSGSCYLVAEVKKDYSPERKRSAIEHQLKPAMSWTRARYGVYWDGTGESCWLIREPDGSLRREKFP